METIALSQEFTSFEEFMDHAENGKTADDISEAGRASRTEESGDWSGVRNFQSAMELARKGWAEGLERVSGMRDRISVSVQSRMTRPMPIYSVAGGFPDVGRFLAGAPDCMVGFLPEEVPNQSKVITLVVSVTASAGVSANIIETRGAAICALVDALEDSGFSVQVAANFAVTGKRTYKRRLAIFDVLLKRAGEPLELDRMAFALAHPAMLRRLMFSIAEQQTKRLRKGFGFSRGEGSYGRVVNLTNTGADISLGSMYSKDPQWESEEAAVAWVLEELKSQGVEIAE